MTYYHNDGSQYHVVFNKGGKDLNLWTGKYSVNSDNWQHLVFTLSDSKIMMYLNGILRDEVKNTIGELEFGANSTYDLVNKGF